jgi:hypothetical protein
LEKEAYCFHEIFRIFFGQIKAALVEKIGAFGRQVVGRGQKKQRLLKGQKIISD